MTFNDYNVGPSQIRNFVLCLLVAVVINIIANVCIMLAVGEDAKIIGVKNRTLWMVLSFFFPFCALIYLAVRKNLEKTVPRMCLNCGATMPPNTALCHNCSSPMLADYKITDEASHKSKRKTLMIIGIVCVVVSFFVSQYAAFNLSNEIVKRYNNGGNNGYNDYYNGFPDGDDFDDGDDFFDDFNNFGN